MDGMEFEMSDHFKDFRFWRRVWISVRLAWRFGSGFRDIEYYYRALCIFFVVSEHFWLSCLDMGIENVLNK
jgi:hypothetical protein